ncbi:MAG: hypothetical protein ACK56K_16385 [Akkermansiaceae bacterium]|jgi:hypothetical protein|nr:hypothetical protein [Luteolibacter sp.]
MKKILIAAKTLIVAMSFSLLCQCSSTQFTGAAPSPPVKKLAIVKNDKILMGDFEPTILKQVNQMGIAASLVDSPPSGNEAYLT